MLKTLMDEEEADQGAWLSAFWKGEWGVDIVGSQVTGPGPCRPLTPSGWTRRFPKAVPSPAVLPVQHLLSSPGFEHPSEQKHRETCAAG